MAENDNSTVVSETILVSGNLSGDEDLTVLGRIEGSINLSRTLIVEQSGIVKADISVRNAVVSGVVVGNISATESVELTETGRMVGDIQSPQVIIVDGARFRGAVDMGDLEAPRPSQPLPERTVSTGLTRSTPRPSSTPAPPARRPAPAPPKPAAAKPAAKPAAKSSSKASAPAKKKIKKKVVVKKRGR